MVDALIRRLQGRILTEPTVDMEICPPIRARPPVTESALAAAESDLGFTLPPLVRALYAQVGDGGFGPGYGLIRLVGHELSLVECRKQMDEESERSLGGRWWPEQLVEMVNWGCHYFSGVDCSSPSCPVFFYDNDCAVEGATLEDCLYPEADSLASWLSAWLNGVDLWENGPKRRKHSNRE